MQSTAVTPERYLGTAVGWFRSARTGGLPTLGALFASFAVPRFGYLLAVLAGMAYGVTLAGYVPIAAIMSILAPESRRATMSIMNLGSGMSTFIGPAIAGVFLPLLGVSGVMWLFAIMYVVAAGISYTLRLPGVRALR